MTSEDIELVLLALMLPPDPFVGVDPVLPADFVAAAHALLEVPLALWRSITNDGVVVPEILTRRRLRMNQLRERRQAGR